MELMEPLSCIRKLTNEVMMEWEMQMLARMDITYDTDEEDDYPEMWNPNVAW